MTLHRQLMAAAGSASTGAATYVEDVFSTYLYTGTGASQTITNGIDLSTKGGMVWTKCRSAAQYSGWVDTARGVNDYLASELTGAYTGGTGISAFGSTGYTLAAPGPGLWNTNGNTYASWTFAKQAKFFDVVTYTGNGVNEREIAHNLGCEPGLIIVKRTDTSANWKVRETQTIGSVLCLNTTDADGNTTYTGGYPALGSTPTTVFKVRDHLNPSDLSCVNASGGTYVAYLFAKSNSGGFGSAGTDSVVACGSFNISGTTNVSLGWEPQFVLMKYTGTDGWYLYDTTRGFSQTSLKYLMPNSSASETTASAYWTYPTSTGFTWVDSIAGYGSGTMIYLAIRKNMKV